SLSYLGVARFFGLRPYSLFRQSLSFFFFQAEDGIRDATVTGVQTCALPISYYERCFQWDPNTQYDARLRAARLYDRELKDRNRRSEERRVGKECRSRWWGED